MDKDNNNTSGFSSLAERLGSRRERSNRDHNKDHRLSKASIGQPIKMNKAPQDAADSSNTGGTPCMVMKCVIVQRDENGYGLTVSGNNPVFVQSVKEDGAAQKAGVLQDDRIIKVNGEKVVNCNHVEVVRMIKADSYVALTLLGLPISNSNNTQPAISENTTSNNNQNYIPKPPKKHAFFDQKVDTIKKMLEQEKNEVEKIKEEYAKNPSQKLLLDLGTAQKLKQDLEKQLWKVESTKNNSSMESLAQQQSPNNLIVTDVDDSTSTENTDEHSFIELDDSTDSVSVYTHKRGDSIASRDRSQTDSSIVNASGNNNELGDLNMPESAHAYNPTTTESNSEMDLLGDLSNQLLGNHTLNQDENKPTTPLPQLQNEDIINFEDDDLANGGDAFRDHGPFNDFGRLRIRPAHLAVFINYVLKSPTHDPSCLFLALAVDSYKQLSSSKELLKQADIISKNFLSPNAPLKVTVDDWITNSIKGVIQSKSSAEDPLRQLFDSAVEVAEKEIRSLLQDYRMKREQGLANWFGDRSLPVDHPDGQITSHDAKIVDDIISPIIIDIQQVSLSDEVDQAKMSIKLELLQNFLTQYGSKRKSRITKVSSYFMKSKEKPSIKGSKGFGSMESIVDEHKTSRLLGFMPKKKKPGSNTESTKSPLKRDKSQKSDQTIWENVPPSFSSTPLKPTRVDNSASGFEHQQASSGLPLSPLVTGQSKKISKSNGKQKSSESISPLSSSQKSLNHGAQRSKSVPSEESSPTSPKSAAQRTSVIPVIQSTHELPSDVGVITGGTVNSMVKQFGDGTTESGQTDTDNLTVVDGTKKKPSRSGSFRRLKDEEKRKSGPPKSHSDPDKNKIEQAITEHNSSMDHLDGVTDSPFLTIEDQKLLGTMSALTSDPEIYMDAVEQHWSDTVPSDVKRSTDKKEVKRQEVINELITTEQHHVRDLKILQRLFYEPLKKNNILNEEELFQVFPNLLDVLQLHREFNKSLQELKENDGYIVKYVGDVVLSRFDRDNGNTFKEECAQFCGNQTKVLSFIKERSKKDPKFGQFLAAAQRHPLCRKLHLKDFVPMEFQRLTKYPLLLDSISKSTKKKDAENNKVKKACTCCREILDFVNQTVKEAEDKQKIVEIQLNLDRGPLMKITNSKSVDEFKNIDLTKFTVIYQGSLTWKLGQMDKRREILLHCILFEHVLVLLQKQDDRYILKCHDADKAGSWSHMPFIKLEKLIVRPDATDKRSFFVMSTSKFGPKMYQFSTVSRTSKDAWIKIITDANDAASRRDASKQITSQRRDGFIVTSTSRENENEAHYDIQQTLSPSDLMPSNKEQYTLEKDDIPLPESEEGQSLSIFEKLQNKQQEISNSLTIKHSLLASLSGIQEDQLEEVLEMSSVDADPDARHLVMHSLLCVDKLTGLLNDCTTPENSFVKRRATSLVERDVDYSNRLSTEVVETGYGTDNENNPQEKWATRVPHPSANEEMNLSPADVSDSTLNSVADIPTSLSDENVGQPAFDGERNENNEATSDGVTSSDNERFYETSEATPGEPSPAYDDAKNSPQHLAAARSPSRPSSFLFEPPKLEVTGETSSVRLSSEVDLMSRGVPITRVMDIVISLQTQLTQLMRVTEDNERDRSKLEEEKQVLLDELTALKQDEMRSHEPPPTYADTIQDLGGKSPDADVPSRSDFANLFNPGNDDDIRPLGSPESVATSTSKRMGRRSTGF